MKWSDGGIKLGLWFNDLNNAEFLGLYAPANFEYDQFQLMLDINLSGAQNKHNLFTNGQVTTNNFDKWNIVFPKYYNSSSFFIHFTDTAYTVEEGIFHGMEKDIPITLYSPSSNIKNIITTIQEILAKFEKNFGAFAHDKVVVLLSSPSGLSGMEYAGATMTTLGALNHELFHSYFARAVFPGNGNAGWIDEALASWQDTDFSERAPVSRNSVNLLKNNPYINSTNTLAYSQGSLLMQEFTYKFKNIDIGFIGIMKQFYNDQKYKIITTEIFRDYLSQFSKDIGLIFSKYVYGGKSQMSNQLLNLNQAPSIGIKSNHPRPYTDQELLDLL